VFEGELGLAVIDINVNGKSRVGDVAPSTSLLNFLRNELELKGSKDACERGECGACTVLVGGKPVMSCTVFAASVKEPVYTIEGLADEAAELRQVFADVGAFQCAFCTPGMVVRAIALLRDEVPLSEDEIRYQISGNICRCTGYQSIVAAIREMTAGFDGSKKVSG
jgi:aerobic-type carbon monoxide dehydrogenase small subunit (CoxS/CutS family)